MKGGRVARTPSRTEISTMDLSPIKGLQDDEEEWLRELARSADTDTLALSFATAREVEQAPVVSYDSQSGQWWSGRFVGQLSFQGRTLTILPRFGMPALRRWLSRIWGIRLLSSTGSYTGGKIWLWELIARLWSDRLVTAAKHGLPRVRADETHVGSTVRGRLLVRETAAGLHVGQHALVSRTRSRRIDPRIGGILLGGFNHLRRQLTHVAEPRQWLTERGQDLISELQASIERRVVAEACRSRSPIRYTPISQSYKPAVDLSLAILGGRPFFSSAQGEQEVYGVLLDMAEIWELYIFHLLRDALSNVEVVHSGRSPDAVSWLLAGRGDDRLGAMKPDILISTHDGAKRLILDAKYKLTTPGASRPSGVLREDLYQMASYLSVATTPGTAMDGALVYPASASIASLEGRGPFRLARTDARLSFMGLECDVPTDVVGLTAAETSFVTAVRQCLAGDSGAG